MAQHFSRPFAFLGAGALALQGCDWPAKSAEDLLEKSRKTVNRQLHSEGNFSAMDGDLAGQIVCGQVRVAGWPARNRHFVYGHGNVVFDDNPEFRVTDRKCGAAAKAAPVNETRALGGIGVGKDMRKWSRN